MTKPTVPLESDRILQIIPAESGWKAWFNGSDDSISSRDVACWAWVETQELTNTGAAYARNHEVVPFVCNGPAGMVDASTEDGYVGLSGPGETLDDRLKKLSEEVRIADAAEAAEDEDEDEDASEG